MRNKKLRVLMFSTEIGNPKETFINNEVKYFSEHHELIFVCLNTTFVELSDFDNIKVIPFKRNLLEKFKYKIISLAKYDLRCNYFSKGLNKLITEFAPNIIHCHFGFKAMILIDNLKEINKYPICIHFHGFDASKMLKEKKYVRKIKSYLIKPNIYPIFVSNYIKQNLEGKQIPTTKGIKLFCGVDTEFFKRDATTNLKKNDTIVFLQVSGLAPKKGHEYTLKAFSIFLKQNPNVNIRLIITGGGPRKEKLKQLASDYSIKDFVDFVGFTNRDQTKKLMQEASVFIHHSITDKHGDTEGLPTSIMEAMAMELPILSTYHAGIPELVKDGVNGYLIKEKDVESYAQKMAEIMSWKKIKINRDIVESDFTYDIHNKKLEDFYRKKIEELQTN